MQDQLPPTHRSSPDIPDVEAVSGSTSTDHLNKRARRRSSSSWHGWRRAFFKGVEEYFTTTAYGNTDLKDILEALEHASGRDLERGRAHGSRPRESTRWRRTSKSAKASITSAALVQSAPADHPTLRPHRLGIGLFDLVGGRLQRGGPSSWTLMAPRTPIPQITGEREPDLVLVNDGDLTYCKIASIRARWQHCAITSATSRSAGSRSLLGRRVGHGARRGPARARYIALALNNIGVETDASTLGTLIARIERAVDSFTQPTQSRRLALCSPGRPWSIQQIGAGWRHAAAVATTSSPPPVCLPKWSGCAACWMERTQPKGLAVDFNVDGGRSTRWLRSARRTTTSSHASSPGIRPTTGQKRAAAARAARPLEAGEAGSMGEGDPRPDDVARDEASPCRGFHRGPARAAQRVRPAVLRSLKLVWDSYGRG